jgi:hypothetical protein
LSLFGIVAEQNLSISAFPGPVSWWRGAWATKRETRLQIMLMPEELPPIDADQPLSAT